MNSFDFAAQSYATYFSLVLRDPKADRIHLSKAITSISEDKKIRAYFNRELMKDIISRGLSIPYLDNDTQRRIPLSWFRLASFYMGEDVLLKMYQQEAVLSSKQRAGVLMFLANLYYRKGKTKDACRLLNSVNLPEKSADDFASKLWFELGKCEIHNKDYKKAQQ